MCHYLDSKHSSPARCWLTYILVDSLKHLLLGNSAVQTGKTLACFCLSYCRLSWQELLPNLKTSFYWSHFSVLRLEQGILSGLRQMALFLFTSAAQRGFQQHELTLIRITTESKPQGAEVHACCEAITSSHWRITDSYQCSFRQCILPAV